MIQRCVTAYLEEKNNQEDVSYTHNDTIRFLYQFLTDYGNRFFDKVHLQKFTPYIKTVIAVYITERLGFIKVKPRNKEKGVVNYDYFQAGKSALKKLKNRKDKNVL